jgi:two-component system phosphate regulon sensor histidine kinase PhoR
MIAKAWRGELRRVAIWLALVVLVGVLLDKLKLALLFGVGAYVAFNLLQVYRLERWLRRRRRDRLPETSGIWEEIFRQLYWLQQRALQRKQRLGAIIDRFKQASEAAPDAAVVLLPGGQIEWLNSAAERLLGLDSPRDVGIPITDLIRAPELSRHLGSSRYGESLELPSPLTEGEFISIRVIPYGDDRRLLLARDITRIHLLEQVRRDFVANVSHELRSPLTVIRGYVETLVDSRDEVPKQWRRPLHQIEQQTTRMCRIVDDLLQLSRLESNPEAAGGTPVAVAPMLETIRDDARGLSGEKLSLHLEADAGLHVAGEYNELYSAFSNLVFNAVQYTPPLKSIYLRWYEDDEGAHLEVEDQGVGIDAEHIPRLTERFYRVDKARSRALGGTGLGLAIVKHVLIRHGAKLRITSSPGEGSTFVCDFPPSRIIRVASLAKVAKG